MTMKKISARKVCGVIKDFCETKKTVTLKTKIEDIALDSINFIELLVRLEEIFEIEFEDEELIIIDYKNVKDIYIIVEKKKNAG